MLSTPPAFVLSQDQTLYKNRIYTRHPIASTGLYQITRTNHFQELFSIASFFIKIPFSQDFNFNPNPGNWLNPESGFFPVLLPLRFLFLSLFNFQGTHLYWIPRRTTSKARFSTASRASRAEQLLIYHAPKPLSTPFLKIFKKIFLLLFLFIFIFIILIFFIFPPPIIFNFYFFIFPRIKKFIIRAKWDAYAKTYKNAGIQ